LCSNQKEKQELLEQSALLLRLPSKVYFPVMKHILLVGLGGFLGSSLRFLIQKYFVTHVYSSFPYSTLVVNLLGSFLIGIILGLSAKYNVLSTDLRLFLATGFCGGFTTFSAFSNDGLLLLKDGNLYYFFIYTISSVIFGLLLAFLGYSLFKII
jgi:CrcB protein